MKRRKVNIDHHPGLCDGRNPIVEAFLRRIAATVERSHMITPEDRVLVAVSGGPDSVALWRVLSCFAPEWSLTLAMVHVNYHLRGAASDAEEAFCRWLAQETGARVFVRSRRARSMGRSRNLQDWARRERYAIFASLAAEGHFDRVALGHHFNDQVETVAAGLLGGREAFLMGGIPRTRGRIIRPLFDCRRTEILDFLRAIQQPYCEDCSNLDQRYLRNRIRRTILPEWRKKYAADIDQTLFHWAERAAEQDEYLSDAASRLVTRAQRGWGSEWISLDLQRVRRFDRRLDFYILRRIAERLSLPDVSPGEHLVRRFGELAASGQAGQKLGWGKALIEIARSAVLFYSRKPVAPQPVQLTMEEPTIAKDWNLRIACRSRERRPGEKTCLPRNAWCFVGAGTKIEPPVILRGPNPGERIRPLGMAGRRKIHDILADAGVPSLLRPITPVLEDRRGVFWVIGHRQDDRVKVTPRTRKLMMIDAEQATRDR